MMKNNKRATVTMWSLFLSIALTMGLFFGAYNYVSYNYDNAGIIDTTVYNQSYADLQTAENNLADNINDTKAKAQAIKEADGNVIYIAWNGLTGLASALRLFLGVIDIGINVWHAIMPGLAFLPPWVIVLTELMLIILIVLTVIGAFKGEAKT